MSRKVKFSIQFRLWIFVPHKYSACFHTSFISMCHSVCFRLSIKLRYYLFLKLKCLYNFLTEGNSEKEPITELKQGHVVSQGNVKTLTKFLVERTGKENPKVRKNLP